MKLYSLQNWKYCCPDKMKCLVLLLLIVYVVQVRGSSCAKDEFRCRDGQCISEMNHCDSMYDCAEGEDEEYCVDIKCNPSLWYNCHNNKCISLVFVCDGENDCGDNSDEASCEVVLPNHETFTVPGVDIKCNPPLWYKCHNDKCISSLFVCDGENDCHDNSDEASCEVVLPTHENFTVPAKPTCSSEEFTCLNEECIVSKWVCDGEPDCVDGSDETLGCGDQLSCHDGFRCVHNHHCIIKEFYCDGYNDCGDNSDEENCTSLYHSTKNCDRADGLYLCKDGILCLEVSQVCDGFPHCFDQSDEAGCDHGHLNCTALGCTHDCHQTPTGALCTCPHGYHLDKDLKSCIDVDECEDFGSCSQRCNNVIGSFICSCDDGYKLRSDKRSCKAKGGEGLLLFSSFTQIRGIYIQSENYFTVAKQLDHATGVGHNGNHVFWTAIRINSEAIVRSNEDGSDQQVIVDVGLGMPEDLAVDYVTGNIYFTDAEKKHIGVCTETGLSCTVLHNEDIDKPRSIAVLPIKGIMFWSDWGKVAMIATSGMDGSNPRPFVLKDIQWPNGLTLDFSNDRLYWVDAKARTIETVRLDGSHRQVVLEKVVEHPYSIAVFEDTLYWSDWEGRQVQKCNKFSGKNLTSIIKEKKKQNVYGVHIYHPALQPRVPNQCLDNFCSHMCLLAPNASYSCACPEYATLGADRHSCRLIEKRPVVIVSAESKLLFIPMQFLGRADTTQVVQLPDVQAISCITYDSYLGSVIIAESVQKKILQYHVATQQLTTLLERGLGHISGMSFDSYGNNLYICDSERRLVEVMSLSTFKHKVVLKSLQGDIPESVVAVPRHGIIYVAVKQPDGSHRLDLIQMDNSRVLSHAVSTGIKGPAVVLSYDKHSDMVYWSDSGSEALEVVNAYSDSREVVQVVSGPPLFLTSYQKHVFWVQEGSNALYWHDSAADGATVFQHEILARLPVDENAKLTLALMEGVDAHHLHPCQDFNGGCSHLCFPSGHEGKNGVCGCPEGLMLDHGGLECIPHAQCTDLQFKCRSDDMCISRISRCDGHKDCPSGDDEEECMTNDCSAVQFTCANGQCISLARRCDYEYDCSDRSDEIGCSATCEEDKFQCGSGECVPKLWRCDYREDCADGSDERSCGSTTCSAGMFQCLNGACIPGSWECDSYIECPDGSDEHENCSLKTCSPEQFTCKNGRCISNNLVCEGTNDCGDGSDEDECMVRVPHCIADEFECNAARCVPQRARCNGTAECPRGEDETDCSNCHLGEFQCRNHRCLYRKWVCDKVDDCGDGSDEDSAMCDHHSGTISIFRPCEGFLCRSGECLAQRLVCNGYTDCGDGSDEGGVCATACNSTACQQICEATPTGAVCACENGFMLATDGRTCSDVDECQEERCSQVCTNTPGSFLCSCVGEYLLKSDRLTCKSTGKPKEVILAGADDIYSLTHNLDTVQLLVFEPGTQISGIEVDARRRLLYWSSAGRGALRVLDLESGHEAGLERAGRPGLMTLDWITGNLYVVDTGFPNSIKVCHVTHKRCVSIIRVETTDTLITGIAVDPLSRILFYSQANWVRLQKPQSTIYRYEVGKNVTVLAKDEISWVSGVVADHTRRYVYWTDLYAQMVERIRYDGTKRQIIFKQEVHRPVSLVLFEDSLFWLTRGSGEVTRCRLYGEHRARCDHFPLYLHSVEFLTVLQASRQPTASNPCANVTCDHYALCVSSQAGGQCVCEDGTVLGNNQECDISNEVLPAVDLSKYGKSYPGPCSRGADSSGGSLSGSSSAVIATLMTVLCICTMFAAYIYFKKRKPSTGVLLETVHFQNPSFGLTHRESTFHPKQLTPGEHEYENPSIKIVQHLDGKFEVLTRQTSTENRPMKKVDFGDFDSDSDSQYEQVIDMKTSLIR